MPKCVNKIWVRRVSSHNTKSALFNVSKARSVISCKLPKGVGTIDNIDIFGVDGVVDASFTLNFLYLIGLKGGVTFSFGSSGYGAMPYISIVTAFKDFGLRMNNY